MPLHSNVPRYARTHRPRLSYNKNHIEQSKENLFVPEVAPEVVPEVIPEVVPEVVPEVAPEVVPEVIPEIIPEVVPEVVPEKNESNELTNSNNTTYRFFKNINDSDSDDDLTDLPI